MSQISAQPLNPRLSVAPLDAAGLEARTSIFAELLHATVLAGASIGFVVPFATEEAAAFWRGKVLPGVVTGAVTLFAAFDRARLVGTVQLDHDMPANQRHRGEVRKMLVHPDARRRGVGRALLAALEARARARGLTLLTLDTRTGDAAEPLYAAAGFETTGIIPGYCRDTLSDRMDSTTIMYKRLV